MVWWLAITLGFFILAVLGVPALRQRVMTSWVFSLYKKILPAMSPTERDALDAGTVWWEGELFSGKPRWEKLLAYPQPQLTPVEQSFLDNECAELCRLTNDWEATQVHQDLSPAAWQFIKDKGFLGMIIPRQYGGLEFSAYAHSQIVQKLSSRSSAAAVSVMVPNSLGPAELLLRYGTEEQKNHYLPRLAKGLEVPAFALTNPHAGSDAAAIPDTGIVCRGEWQGQQVLGMRVSWEKRYITLGPVCTLLGLAFHLHDPDHLLGDIEDIGITCALVPSKHPGVHIGRRHWPLNAVFQNGPNWGQDVFMPLDWIIGGPAMAGHGWRMVMECLAAGRAISLPSTSTGIAKLAVRATGGYARVRSQFNLAIGKFEGVEEALARMGGNTYLMDAARMMTAGAVDLGEHPSVASAIVKYHVTERARSVVNDAMDVLGGKGICLGPNNFMARAYQQIPIAITVEGANILTRSLIIFGQGAIRCHPFVLREMQATQHSDAKAGLRAFDTALVGHIGFAIGNALRALWLGLTGSHFVGVPASVAPETKRYYQQLTRFSAAFAFLSDVSMLVLGGGLKRREKLSARLGDILSQMYLASATLKRYQDEGCQAADAPLMHWAIWDAMFRAQQAFEGVLANFPNKPAAWLLARIIFPLGRPYVVPADELGHDVAKCLITPSATRDRLTDGMYLPQNEAEASDDAVGLVELALAATLAAEPAETKLRAAVKAGKVGAGNTAMNEQERLHQAQQTGVLAIEEAETITRRYDLRDKVIRVDDFPPDFSQAAHK
ncbi:MAG: acyl-CoA dehydrogenase [Rugosibacter sp.]|nr:acyl-CoA dehydrogenase [Rugosibacter sp.]